MENVMATAMVKPVPNSLPRRSQDVDRHVGARIRERRIRLGLTQPQLAELIGVTYQQAHKYEIIRGRGSNAMRSSDQSGRATCIGG